MTLSAIHRVGARDVVLTLQGLRAQERGQCLCVREFRRQRDLERPRAVTEMERQCTACFNSMLTALAPQPLGACACSRQTLTAACLTPSCATTIYRVALVGYHTNGLLLKIAPTAAVYFAKSGTAYLVRTSTTLGQAAGLVLTQHETEQREFVVGCFSDCFLGIHYCV